MFTATLLGLCAEAVAAPLAVAARMVAVGANFPGLSGVRAVDRIGPDFDFLSPGTGQSFFDENPGEYLPPLVSPSLGDIPADADIFGVAPPDNDVHVPEPSTGVIVLAGLGFLGVSGILRQIPRHKGHAHRRKIVERMMA